jgi:uronate dehydrogenase
MLRRLRITKGVDAVVHLGGYSVEGPWERILSANIIGCYNVFEAARRNGVKRSSFRLATTRGLLPPRRDHRPPRLSEARQPLRRVQGVRRGARQPLRRQVRHGGLLHAHRQREPGPIDKRRLSIWISPRDWRSS